MGCCTLLLSSFMGDGRSYANEVNTLIFITIETTDPKTLSGLNGDPWRGRCMDLIPFKLTSGLLTGYKYIMEYFFCSYARLFSCTSNNF